MGSNPTLSFLKAKDGFEPSLKDLQSHTLPLCYLAYILYMKTNKKIFTYKNRIILTNGSSIKINSIKFIKNYQLNLILFTNFKSKKINEIIKDVPKLKSGSF